MEIKNTLNDLSEKSRLPLAVVRSEEKNVFFLCAVQSVWERWPGKSGLKNQVFCWAAAFFVFFNIKQQHFAHLSNLQPCITAA